MVQNEGMSGEGVLRECVTGYMAGELIVDDDVGYLGCLG
jgi:hypothetical protein